MVGTPVVGPAVQIAYAVDDTRAAARSWVDVGIGPFFLLDHITVVNARIDGTSAVFDHSSAYSWWGSVMVELICEHGVRRVGATTGIHHVATFVDDFHDARSTLLQGGAGEVLYAETAAGMPFAMHDGGPLGHLVEIYERTDRLAAFYDMVRTTAESWDGNDPFRQL